MPIQTTDVHLLTERKNWQGDTYDEALSHVEDILDGLLADVFVAAEKSNVDYAHKEHGVTSPRTHSTQAADIVSLIMKAVAAMKLDQLIDAAGALSETESSLRAVSLTRKAMPDVIARAWVRWEAVEADTRDERRARKEAATLNVAADKRCERVLLSSGEQCKRECVTLLAFDGVARRVCRQHAGNHDPKKSMYVIREDVAA